MPDEAFLDAFRSGILPLEAFTHEAHLRLGWLHLRRENRDEAICNVLDEIGRYVVIHGKEDKFHHTLTVAAMLILHERISSSEVRTFQELLAKHPDLLTDLRGLVEKHYSISLLSSSEAAKRWVEPDLVPF